MSIVGSGTKRNRASTPQKKNRFAVGAKVTIINLGVSGVATQGDDDPTVLFEYWHTIKTERGDIRQPGCNLELVPTPMTNFPQSAHSIHLHGDHSRINVNSVDNSTNLISESNTVLFARMREQATAIEDATDREDIVARVAELEKAQGSSGFFHAYQNFIASAANHMTLFAPFLPALAELLHHAK